MPRGRRWLAGSGREHVTPPEWGGGSPITYPWSVSRLRALGRDNSLRGLRPSRVPTRIPSTPLPPARPCCPEEAVRTKQQPASLANRMRYTVCASRSHRVNGVFPSFRTTGCLPVSNPQRRSTFSTGGAGCGPSFHYSSWSGAVLAAGHEGSPLGGLGLLTKHTLLDDRRTKSSFEAHDGLCSRLELLHLRSRRAVG